MEFIPCEIFSRVIDCHDGDAEDRTLGVCRHVSRHGVCPTAMERIAAGRRSLPGSQSWLAAPNRMEGATRCARSCGRYKELARLAHLPSAGSAADLGGLNALSPKNQRCGRINFTPQKCAYSVHTNKKAPPDEARLWSLNRQLFACKHRFPYRL